MASSPPKPLEMHRYIYKLRTLLIVVAIIGLWIAAMGLFIAPLVLVAAEFNFYLWGTAAACIVIALYLIDAAMRPSNT